MLITVVAAMIALAAAGAWVWSRRRPAPDAQTQRTARLPRDGRPTRDSPPQRDARPRAEAAPKAKQQRFGAVEIRLRNAACAAARQLDGQRFLANEAPELPLANCSAPRCSCRFVKLSDRRTEDRRLEYEGNAAAFLASDRREKQDRRYKT